MPTKVQGRANEKAHESSIVTSPQEYRRRARHLLQMAKTCRDTQIASRLRVIAADYLDCAGQDASGRTQRKAS
jgi:hypothetical protein